MYFKIVMVFWSEIFNRFVFNGKMVFFNLLFFLMLSKFDNLIYMIILFIKKSKVRFEKVYERFRLGMGCLNIFV